MATQTLTQQNFEKTMNISGIVLMDFWAPWCGPCRQFAPTFEASSQRHPDVVHAKVNTEVEQSIAEAVGIRSIPTIKAYRDGILVFSQIGTMTAGQLDELISQMKALDMDEVSRLAAEQSASHA